MLCQDVRKIKKEIKVDAEASKFMIERLRKAKKVYQEITLGIPDGQLG